MERRLAAILAADVVGDSRLMEQDEAGTFERLCQRRRCVSSRTTGFRGACRRPAPSPQVGDAEVRHELAQAWICGLTGLQKGCCATPGCRIDDPIGSDVIGRDAIAHTHHQALLSCNEYAIP
jgi:hypothetical protein